MNFPFKLAISVLPNHQSGPFQRNDSTQHVQRHGTQTIFLQEGHEEAKANEDHDVDILKHYRADTTFHLLWDEINKLAKLTGIVFHLLSGRNVGSLAMIVSRLGTVDDKLGKEDDEDDLQNDQDRDMAITAEISFCHHHLDLTLDAETSKGRLIKAQQIKRH